ncbi:cobalt-zinc-cadmium efflux system outer membrane protein [Pelomonas saccharophila]|uniref:Cobalt-zinc-cadmium efflux system outer membrane protein n=1 Tax=Roseateles saccharophilus TaxID=304 RepID=A0ABU1YH60_ROSSA|nr:TolC family protein [Roseateles saccharophilus]MDR7268187.1 cobalt-zinc-cadmium efflux system outer membrane protein [Roseateles saccharophilus]
MRTLAFLPALLMALAPGVTHAITLAEARALAQAHNPELAAARLELQALQAAELQAGARPNPELGVLLEDTQRSATRTSTVQLSQAIELGGKRAARLAAAAQTREQAAVALQAKQAEIRAAVTAAFSELLAAQQQQGLAESSLELARGAAHAADKRLQAGKVAPLEPAKARVAEAGARAELAQARSALLLARGRLAALWSQSPQAVTPAEGDATALPRLPDEQRLAEQLPDAPALRLARLDIARHQALTEGERARRVPDLTVTVGAKRDAEQGRTQAVIGFSVPLPLHDRNQGALLQALRREDQAREALTVATLKLQGEVAEAGSRLRLSHEQVQLLRDEALPTAQTAYDTALKGYELGKFAFLDVLDAQRSLFQLRRQLLQDSAAAHRAAADLERLLGRNPSEE